MRTRTTRFMQPQRWSLGLVVAAALAVTALLFAGPAGAASITVYCPGGNLQDALDNAPQYSTIVIYGTCYGNFGIFNNGTNFGDLTLQGGAPGATLNGRGSGPTLTVGYGSDVTVRNLTMTNGGGNAGGGLYAFASAHVAVLNSTIKGNHASGGGGIYVETLASVDLTGVTVTRNTASYAGGGIYVYDGSLGMTASTVSQNKSIGEGAKYGGGGIWLQSANALLTNTRVTANTSGDYGGGIANYGINGGECLGPRTPPVNTCAVGATPSIISTGLTLVNSSVDHNTAADDGGGIYNESSEGDAPVVLQGSKVSFNKASGGDGGGIANYGECGFTASLLATGSTFQGNLATNGEGGAVYNAAGVDGCGEAGTGLVTVAQSPAANGPNVVNANQAMYGGGFANEQGDGVASLTLQPGAKVTGNKASVTGGGVWNNCGSFSSLAQIFLNTPNNVVSGCF